MGIQDMQGLTARLNLQSQGHSTHYVEQRAETQGELAALAPGPSFVSASSAAHELPPGQELTTILWL